MAVNYDLVRHDYNAPAAGTVLFVDLNPTGSPFSTRHATRISQQTLGNAGINVLVRDTNTDKRWASGPTKAAITLSRNDWCRTSQRLSQGNDGFLRLYCNRTVRKVELGRAFLGDCRLLAS